MHSYSAEHPSSVPSHCGASVQYRKSHPKAGRASDGFVRKLELRSNPIRNRRNTAILDRRRGPEGWFEMCHNREPSQNSSIVPRGDAYSLPKTMGGDGHECRDLPTDLDPRLVRRRQRALEPPGRNKMGCGRFWLPIVFQAIAARSPNPETVKLSAGPTSAVPISKSTWLRRSMPSTAIKPTETRQKSTKVTEGVRHSKIRYSQCLTRGRTRSQSRYTRSPWQVRNPSRVRIARLPNTCNGFIGHCRTVYWINQGQPGGVR